MIQEAGGRVNKEGCGEEGEGEEGGGEGEEGEGEGEEGEGEGEGGRERRGSSSRGSGSRDNACDVQWNLVESDDDIMTCPTAAFTENTGPQTPLTEASQPVDFFRHFFDDDILALLVDETNM